MGDRLSSQTAPGTDQPAPVGSKLRRLGRYELISQLAKGGMGEVHLARARGQGGFERLVVIKCALPSLSDEHSQMLLAEARLAATLQHTNIVQVYDAASEGHVVFLAMEFLHGQDVRAVLRRSWGQRQPLPVEQAIAIVLAACGGLHYAHEKRDADGLPLEIVHRDVSPSNVFVMYDGGVKLIDFGIAKATALPSETQLGSVKGKPGYMSPEQCRCEPLDRRTDIFCLGILLYELTCGRKPFVADNEYQLHKQIIECDPPRPTEVNPSYPPALEAIVMRALSKDRRARQPTAAALQTELAAFASEHRFDVSQFALGRVMERLFADELAAWHAAQRQGSTLVEHVVKRTTSTVAIVDALTAQGTNRTGDAASAQTDSPAPTVRELPPPPRRRAGWAIAALVGAAAAVTTTVFVARASKDPSEQDARPPTPVVPAEPRPAHATDRVTAPMASAPVDAAADVPAASAATGVEPAPTSPPPRTKTKPSTRPPRSHASKRAAPTPQPAPAAPPPGPVAPAPGAVAPAPGPGPDDLL